MYYGPTAGSFRQALSKSIDMLISCIHLLFNSLYGLEILLRHQYLNGLLGLVDRAVCTATWMSRVAQGLRLIILSMYISSRTLRSPRGRRP